MTEALFASGKHGALKKSTETERAKLATIEVADRSESPLSLVAHDSYANALAGLGESSPLLSGGTWTRTRLTNDRETLTALYLNNWIARRVIDMPAEDATRPWYRLLTPLLPMQQAALHRLEARHNIRGELTNAIRWARLYGGSVAVMVLRGQEDLLHLPLDLNAVTPGSFQGLLVLDRTSGVEPSPETETNLDDPDFGAPLYYTVDTGLPEMDRLTVHHSRVLRFLGRELPWVEERACGGWGVSELEHLHEELQKRDATSANIAELVFRANITTLKMSDFGEVLAMGTDLQRSQVLSAMESQNRLRTSFGLQVLSAGDSLETHPYNFAGLSDIYECFMMDMAGAAGIPATRLFGRSPQGMNATGESDRVIYEETLADLREKMLRPALERLLPVMTRSALGYEPELSFEFGRSCQGDGSPGRQGDGSYCLAESQDRRTVPLSSKNRPPVFISA